MKKDFNIGEKINEPEVAKITIKETIDDYIALKKCVAGETLRSLFELAINENDKVGGFVKNDTYFHALFLTEMMFQKTSESLFIFCGRDVARFINTIKGAFLGCCERIMENNGPVRIVSQVFNPSDEENALNALKSLANEVRSKYEKIDLKGMVIRDNNDEKLNHFIVCDSKMLRIEELHDPLNDDSSAGDISAKVYFDNVGLATEYETSFKNDYKF